MRPTRTLTIVKTADGRGTSDCRGDGSDATGMESKYNGIWNGCRTGHSCSGERSRPKGYMRGGAALEETDAASNVAEKKMQVRVRNARTGTCNKNDSCGICVDVIQHLTRGKVDRVLAQYLPFTAIDGRERG